MTDVMKATVSFKRIHKIADKRYKETIQKWESMTDKHFNEIDNETIDALLKVNTSLQYILTMERERHDNLISVAQTRYEEMTHGAWNPFRKWIASAKISIEFLYAWFFKK